MEGIREGGRDGGFVLILNGSGCKHNLPKSEGRRKCGGMVFSNFTLERKGKRKIMDYGGVGLVGKYGARSFAFLSRGEVKM